MGTASALHALPVVKLLCTVLMLHRHTALAHRNCTLPCTATSLTVSLGQPARQCSFRSPLLHPPFLSSLRPTSRAPAVLRPAPIHIPVCTDAHICHSFSTFPSLVPIPTQMQQQNESIHVDPALFRRCHLLLRLFVCIPSPCFNLPTALPTAR